jgi:stringent starvation protein B
MNVTDQKMTSTRPYLVRALYEWIIDNQCTPYLLVNALDAGTRVPQEYVKDGQIILNLAPGAIRGLVMDNERIEFSARFGGVARSLHVPVSAVMAIYAKENGKGMFFDPSEEVVPPRPPVSRPAPVPDVAPEPPRKPSPDDGAPGGDGSSGGGSSGGGKSGKGKTSKRPSLKVVK